MNVAALLAELRRRDIHLSAAGGELRCSAPSGALTPELRARMQQHKQEILEFLSSAQALAGQQRAIVPLQRAGGRTPVFGVPGHNGDVFCYRALAQALGDEQPFFGLQPPGLDGSGLPLRRVEDLAAYFAAQIRTFRAEGPYIVAGFCAGGAVAFELAQQLRRGGATVSLLALFGSPYPSYFRLPRQLWQGLLGHAHRVRNVARVLVSGGRKRFFTDKLSEHRARRRAARAASSDPVLLRRAKVERATVSAVRRYRPAHFPGRLCLFVPGPLWQNSGVDGLRWRALAQQAETYFGPEASQGHDMLRDHAAAFAELFRRCRDKSETRSVEAEEQPGGASGAVGQLGMASPTKG